MYNTTGRWTVDGADRCVFLKRMQSGSILLSSVREVVHSSDCAIPISDDMTIIIISSFNVATVFQITIPQTES